MENVLTIVTFVVMVMAPAILALDLFDKKNTSDGETSELPGA